MPIIKAAIRSITVSLFCFLAFLTTGIGSRADELTLRGSYPNTPAKSAPEKTKWFLRTASPDTITTGSLIRPGHDSVDGDSQFRAFVADFLQSSDALRAVKHDSLATQEARREARFTLLPEVNFTTEIGRTNNPLTTGGPRVERSTDKASINASWKLFNSGASLAAIRAADFSALASSNHYLAEERRTLMESLGLYLQIYAGQQLVASHRKTRKRLSAIRYSIAKQFKAGFASKTDIAQVDAEIAALDTQIESAKRQVSQQKITWKIKTRKKITGSLAKPDIRSLLGKNKQAVLSRALQGNVTVASAKYAALSAHEKSRSDMASFLPGVSAYVNATDELSSSLFSNSNFEWSAGVRLTVPIVNFVGTSKYRQSREAANAAKYRAQDTKQKIVQDIETNWQSFVSYRANETNINRKISTIRKVVKGVSKEVKAGFRPVENLLREEIKLADGRMEQLQNEINMIASAYRIAIHFSNLKLSDFTTR